MIRWETLKNRENEFKFEPWLWHTLGRGKLYINFSFLGTFREISGTENQKETALDSIYTSLDAIVISKKIRQMIVLIINGFVCAPPFFSFQFYRFAMDWVNPPSWKYFEIYWFVGVEIFINFCDFCSTIGTLSLKVCTFSYLAVIQLLRAPGECKNGSGKTFNCVSLIFPISFN